MIRALLFVIGVVLIAIGLPTLGGGLVFAIALDGFCREFGNEGRGRH